MDKPTKETAAILKTLNYKDDYRQIGQELAVFADTGELANLDSMYNGVRDMRKVLKNGF